MKIHVKIEEESLFLYETSTETVISDAIRELVLIHNGRCHVHASCTELSDLCKHGVSKRTDDELDDCSPTDGYADPNGGVPNERMADIIRRVVAEARSAISNESVAAEVCLTRSKLRDVLEMLTGALSIAFPAGLLENEPVEQEMRNLESCLEGNETCPLRVQSTELWWAGKQLLADKKLKDYVGKNEKTKIVAKLQKIGHGAPGREPTMTEDERRQMMLHSYNRQEVLKRLEEDSDCSYLDSSWADRQELRKNFHGLENISWKPK